MSGRKGTINETYAVHGTGLETIREGFAELGMPIHRRDEAFAIVKEVLEANDVVVFRWYKPPSTDELLCYWDDEVQNQLWITTSEVHIPKDEQRVRRPGRAITWSKQDGDYVGWLLPGAESGSGGGRRETEVAEVLCPETFLLQPAGIPCPTCEVVHGT